MKPIASLTAEMIYWKLCFLLPSFSSEIALIIYIIKSQSNELFGTDGRVGDCTHCSLDFGGKVKNSNQDFRKPRRECSENFAGMNRKAMMNSFTVSKSFAIMMSTTTSLNFLFAGGSGEVDQLRFVTCSSRVNQ